MDLVAKDVALLLVNLDAAGKDGREQEEAGAADEHVAADVQRHGGRLGHGVAVAGGLNEAGGSKDDSPYVDGNSLGDLLAELLCGAVDALATTQGDELIDIGDVVEQNIGQILEAHVEELPDGEDDGVGDHGDGDRRGAVNLTKGEVVVGDDARSATDVCQVPRLVEALLGHEGDPDGGADDSDDLAGHLHHGLVGLRNLQTVDDEEGQARRPAGSGELRGDLCIQDLAEGLVAEGRDNVDEKLLDTLADALDLLLSDLLGGVLPRRQVHAEQRDCHDRSVNRSNNEVAERVGLAEGAKAKADECCHQEAGGVTKEVLVAGEVRTLLEVIGHLDGKRRQVGGAERVRDVVDQVQHKVVRETKRRSHKDERLGDHHRDSQQDPETAAAKDAADLGSVEVIGHKAHERAQNGVEIDGERADQRSLACGQTALRGQEQHHVAVRKAQGTGVEHAAHTKAQARPECDLALFTDLVSHRAPSLFSIVL